MKYAVPNTSIISADIGVAPRPVGLDIMLCQVPSRHNVATATIAEGLANFDNSSHFACIKLDCSAYFASL